MTLLLPFLLQQKFSAISLRCFLPRHPLLEMKRIYRFRCSNGISLLIRGLLQPSLFWFSFPSWPLALCSFTFTFFLLLLLDFWVWGANANHHPLTSALIYAINCGDNSKQKVAKVLSFALFLRSALLSFFNSFLLNISLSLAEMHAYTLKIHTHTDTYTQMHTCTRNNTNTLDCTLPLFFTLVHYFRITFPATKYSRFLLLFHFDHCNSVFSFRQLLQFSLLFCFTISHCRLHFVLILSLNLRVSLCSL